LGKGTLGGRHTKVNDELNDLENSDVLLPPDANATGALEVVPVHNDVDHEVQCDWDPRYGCQANQLGVAEESSGAMMIGVKEGL